MTTLSEYSKKKFYTGIELWRVDKDFAEPMFNYLVYGYSPGSFFTAVLANDFRSAMARSHPSNTVTALKALTGWMGDCMPRRAFGSYEAVDAWLEMKEEDRRQILVMHNLIYTGKQETFLAIKGDPVYE
jgi:hypothetical protein